MGYGSYDPDSGFGGGPGWGGGGGAGGGKSGWDYENAGTDPKSWAKTPYEAAMGGAGPGAKGTDLIGYDKNGNPMWRDGLTPEQRAQAGGWAAMNNIGNYAAGIGGRKAPTMQGAVLDPYTKMDAATIGPMAMAGGVTIDQAAANEARKYQMGLMGQLQTQASGGGPSLAGQQLKAGMDQSIAAQMAAAASQKGVGQGALGVRGVAQMAAQGQQQLAQQSALARMQEQFSAQQQLGGLSSSVRGQDLTVAGQQAGFNQATAFANQQAANQAALAQAGFWQQANAANAGAANQYGLQQGAFNQQAAQANLNSYLANQGMNDQAQQWGWGSLMGEGSHARDRETGYASAAADRSQRQGALDWGKVKDYAGFAAGAAMMLSDERQKTGVTSGTASVREFLRSAGTHAYRYRNPEAPGAGEGRFVSPMAQELEKTAIGKSAVEETPDGTKMVNYGKLAGAMLAGEADHERRLSSLEEAIRSYGSKAKPKAGKAA